MVLHVRMVYAPDHCCAVVCLYIYIYTYAYACIIGTAAAAAVATGRAGALGMYPAGRRGVPEPRPWHSRM